MANEPHRKISPHLPLRPRRFPDDAAPSDTRRMVRRLLSAAALLVALFAFYPLLQRTSDRLASPDVGMAHVTDCDRLGAHSSDTQKLAPGVDDDELDIAKVKTACAAALKRQPGDGRILYQLGRAYFRNKEYGPGVDYWRQSAAAGYAQGAFVLGLILVQGTNIAPNVCEGGQLWVKAARARHLYSRLYLANKWREGVFKTCDLAITEPEISELLTAADDLIETPKQKTDVTQAKLKWLNR